MALTPSKHLDEVCYPFILERSVLCDYEVITDELCALIGAALAQVPESMADISADLDQLQPLAFHANGSVRGRLAISEDDLGWVNARLSHYQEEISEQLKGFVLPRGAMPVAQLNACRSSAKKAIRALVRVDEQGIEVPAVLPRLLNLMCNLLFTLTLVVNQRRGFTEVPFTSKSYGKLT